MTSLQETEDLSSTYPLQSLHSHTEDLMVFLWFIGLSLLAN